MSDPQAKYCLYGSETMNKFVGTDLGAQTCPVEKTIYKFHHLIGEKEIDQKIFPSVNAYLKAQGIKNGN